MDGGDGHSVVILPRIGCSSAVELTQFKEHPYWGTPSTVTDSGFQYAISRAVAKQRTPTLLRARSELLERLHKRMLSHDKCLPQLGSVPHIPESRITVRRRTRSSARAMSQI